MEQIILESAENRAGIGVGTYRHSSGIDYVTLGFDWGEGESLFPAQNVDGLKWVNNTVFGPQDGPSLLARLLGGSDSVVINGGLNNWVNTNWDDDKLFLEGGHGVARGGIGNDLLQVRGGFWNVVNGNQGNDEIINGGYLTGTLRGGAGNDTLVNFGGGVADFYGDDGADTFRPYVLDEYGNTGSTLMRIKDFEPGVDTLDLSAAGGANFSYIDGHTYIGSNWNNGLIAIVENVLL